MNMRAEQTNYVSRWLIYLSISFVVIQAAILDTVLQVNFNNVIGIVMCDVFHLIIFCFIVLSLN